VKWQFKGKAEDNGSSVNSGGN